MYSHSNRRPLARRRQPGIRPWLPAAGLLCLAFTGCAALTNPVAEGIPVRRLPPEVLFGDLKDPKVALPLTMLGQPEPEAYRLGPGDILGIFIEGALGERNAPPPPHWPDPPVIKPALGMGDPDPGKVETLRAAVAPVFAILDQIGRAHV